jgi:AcrR family transcriptional regulator
MAPQKPAIARKKNSRSRQDTRWGGEAQRKNHRQEAILRSVANVLRNSRLSSLTIQDVADELGMTKGSLYYYFKDKQDILFQCHMRSMAISLQALEKATAEGRTPSESLRILLIGHIRGILDAGFGSILQTDLENFRPEQRKTYIRKRDELERGVRNMIEDGIRAGEFECPNVKLAGFVILGAINWIPKWYRAEGAFSAEMIAEQMVDYFMHGLRPPVATAQRRAAKRGHRTEVQKPKQPVVTLEDLQ